MTAFATSKRYHAFGEESDYRDGDCVEKHSRLLKTAHASVSERSFGSTDSKWSIMRYNPTANFDEHIAGGVGDANSVRSDMTDNLLNELERLMPGMVPNFEAPTESNHPRQIGLYLERLEAGLPPAGVAEERESVAIIRLLRRLFGFGDAQEGFNVVAEIERLLTPENIVALLRRIVRLSILITLAVVIATLPQVFGVDLPDYFMHAVFLLVMAVVATAVMI